MTKKDYKKPVIQDMGILEESALLAYSVQSDGLGENPEDELTQDETPGNAWGEALSRRGHQDFWDDEESLGEEGGW